MGASTDFDGTNDYVSMADSASLDITDAITLMAWVYKEQTKTVGNQNQYVLDKQNRYSMLISPTTDLLRFFAAGSPNADVSSTTAISNNVWTHVVCTYDKDAEGNQVNIYINGVLDMQGTSSITMSTDNNEARIGCYSNSGGSCAFSWGFDGQIMDARIYNRALSLGEIKSCMHKMNDVVNGMVLHIPLFEEGSTYKDLSGNGNDGTDNGTTPSSNGPETSLP